MILQWIHTVFYLCHLDSESHHLQHHQWEVLLASPFLLFVASDLATQSEVCSLSVIDRKAFLVLYQAWVNGAAKGIATYVLVSRTPNKDLHRVYVCST